MRGVRRAVRVEIGRFLSLDALVWVVRIENKGEVFGIEGERLRDTYPRGTSRGA